MNKIIQFVYSDFALECSKCGFLGLAFWNRIAQKEKVKHENKCDGTVTKKDLRT